MKEAETRPAGCSNPQGDLIVLLDADCCITVVTDAYC